MNGSKAPARPRSVPATLPAWLAGWRVSARTGNPYLKLGEDFYAVFRDRKRGGWTASVGRSFTNLTWPDPESAKAGLFDLVQSSTPERLAALHAGSAAPEAVRQAEAPQDAPETLLMLAREQTEVRLERRSYEGKPFLALVVYKFGPSGARCDNMVSIRMGEAERLADAINAACLTSHDAQPSPRGDRQSPQEALRGDSRHSADESRGPPTDRPRDDETPAYVDRGRPQREPWNPAALTPAQSPRSEFDEFAT
jgi:hypothetical protein